MQPSAQSLHLGNYLGALTQWIELQHTHEALFSVVDLHAITVAQDPSQLREKTLLTAAQYIAAGVNPEKAILYIQSHVPAHSQLSWILTTITGYGEAARMTQFKEKSSRQNTDGINVGLFSYPILMAADILLYNTNIVPVGEDQKQHVELTRNLANRFNSRFGQTFTVPETFILKDGARIYDLQDPTSKMSKSAESEAGIVWALDDPDVTRKKIMRAVTDTENEIRFDRTNKPGISNLLTLFCALTKTSVEEAHNEFAGTGYGGFKTAVADAVTETFAPIRTKTHQLLQDRHELERLLSNNADKASEIAETTLQTVHERIGLVRKK